MKKLYTSPESFVIELDAEDIVTASKPSVTTTVPGVDTPDVPTTEATTEVDLDPIDTWLPSIDDWE